jgi:hypothetical protein
VLGVAAAFAAPARADGDPASDILLGQDVFLSYGTTHGKASAALTERVRAVVAAGDRIKVALIAAPFDLGSVSNFFGKPTAYAGFIGIEISQYYAGPLLVVMPTGFGLYDARHSTKGTERLLAKIKIKRKSPEGLAEAATAAIRTLSGAGALRWKDTLAPRVIQRFTPAKAGQTVTLAYFVIDDSGRSSETITIYAGSTPLKVIRLPLQPFTSAQSHAGRPGVVEPSTLKWRAPDRLPPDLRYCVVATDPSGNKSQPACIWLQVHAG